MKNDHIIIFVTCSSLKEAAKIAGALLDKRLVACANTLSGVSSKFWWLGKLDKASETLVMLKTVGRNFSCVEREVKKLHSYDVPEIIAVPIAYISSEYKRWIDDCVK